MSKASQPCEGVYDPSQGSTSSGHTNRLIHEKSPYLLQHAHNPVDWFPWGPEAFAKAKKEDKSLFLSISYSTCHWCHVMEAESFEREDVARILNENFVSIKVDREERPDLDEIYMTATQLATGSGGWPNSVWLTPDGRPWYAGTYFPLEDRAGMPGFKSVLAQLADAWRTRRAQVEKQADRLAEAMRNASSAGKVGPGLPSDSSSPAETAELRRAGAAELRRAGPPSGAEGLSAEASAFAKAPAFAEAAAGKPADKSAKEGSTSGELVKAALNELRNSFDERFGGFGAAPKFPPHAALGLLFYEFRKISRVHAKTPSRKEQKDAEQQTEDVSVLCDFAPLREHNINEDDSLLRMATATLEAMSRGGIHDHVGGGFHRYSTDARWFLPHFEKMLYDNAQLARAYSEAFLLTGNEEYRATATDTCDWILREMTDPAGGFYSALDADSEGVEGKFYVWTRGEILAVLGAEEGDAFCRIYGVEEKGNFRDEATGRASGANILYLRGPLDKLAQVAGMPSAGSSSLTAAPRREPLGRAMSMVERADGLRARLEGDRKKLLLRRDGRVRPRCDDQVLAGWNGLMIGALAFAGKHLDAPRYTAAAERAAGFVLTAMRRDGPFGGAPALRSSAASAFAEASADKPAGEEEQGRPEHGRMGGPFGGAQGRPEPLDHARGPEPFDFAHGPEIVEGLVEGHGRMGGRLFRSWRGNEARLNAYLDDYAFLADGLLELYESTGDRRWLDEAKSLMAVLKAHYWDQARSGFYLTPDDHEDLLLRLKPSYDQATPSGNGVAARVLIRLGRLTGDAEYFETARATLNAFLGLMQSAPQAAHSLILATAMLQEAKPAAHSTTLIARPRGSRRGAAVRELEPAAHSTTLPLFAAPLLPPSLKLRRTSRRAEKSRAAVRELEPATEIAAQKPVAVETSPATLKVVAGGSGEVTLRVVIAKGYHINSRKPLDAYLVPTELTLDGKNVASLRQVTYPAGAEKNLGFSKKPLSVYEGTVEIRAQISLGPGATPGIVQTVINLRVQPCSDESCLAPQVIPVPLTLEVAGAATGR